MPDPEPEAPRPGLEPPSPTRRPRRPKQPVAAATMFLVLAAAFAGYLVASRLDIFFGGGSSTREFTTMNTFARIFLPERSDILTPNAGHLDAAEAVVRRVNDLMGPAGDLSDVKRLNSAPANTWVAVDPLTWNVVMEALRWHRLSDGAFDPTIGPLKSLFHFDQAATDEWPDDETLRKARQRVGADKLLFDREGMRLAWAEDGMRLDLGAIAKGYAADLAAETLLKRGIKHAMVEIGGELRFFGGKPGKAPTPWRAGVRNPRPSSDADADDAMAEVLEMHDGGVATSGDYERFFIRNGKRYQHILDPRTGLPLESGPGSIAGVTVAHLSSCLAADALATTLCVMGPRRGLRFIEEQALGLLSGRVRVTMFIIAEDGVSMERTVVTVDDRGGVTVEEG